MAYIIKQKLKLEDLANVAKPPLRVLLYEPDSDLGQLYVYYLQANDFEVWHHQDFSSIRQAISSFQPQLLLLSSDGQFSVAGFQSVLSQFPGLKAVSFGYNLKHEAISQLMRAGILSHINRRLTRPNDLAVIVKSLV